MHKQVTSKSKHIFIQAFLFSLAFGLYLSQIHADTAYFANDLDAHIKFVKIILASADFPKPYDCFECWQPPLYYVMAAYTLRLFGGLFDNILDSVSYLSVAFYGLYVYFSYRLLNDNIKNKSYYYLALSLVLFWPIGIPRSVIIANDIPSCMAQVACFYFLICWYKNLKNKHLIYALIFSALAINFKSSGLLSAIIIGLVVLYKYYYAKLKYRDVFNGKIMAAVLIIMLISAFPIGRLYYYKHAENREEPITVWNYATMGKENYITNDAKFFYGFDFKAYLTKPNMHPYDVSTGRDYFWNYLLKSSLLSSREWKAKTTCIILAAVQLLILAYMFLTALQIFWKDRKQTHELAPYIIFIGVQVVAMWIYRYFYPYGVSQDYRYIFAVTPVMIALFALLINWYKDKKYKIREWVGLVLGYVFLALIVIVDAIQFIPTDISRLDF